MKPIYTKNLFVIAAVILLAPLDAFAANLQAQACQISIKKMYAFPGSHNTGNIGVVVKTGWIGNDEYIEDVKFYGYAFGTDLGNRPDCSGGYVGYSRGWGYQNASEDSYYANAWGEYLFTFPIFSGSVVTGCPGYTFTTVGTFFVQTNKNTYWINPEFSANKHFQFDAHTYRAASRQGGWFSPVYTTDTNFQYYNPGACQ